MLQLSLYNYLVRRSQSDTVAWFDCLQVQENCTYFEVYI